MTAPRTTGGTLMDALDQELVDRLRRLVDNQPHGDAAILVQRQLFNKVVGRLVSLASRAPAGDHVPEGRPERVQAAFDVWRERAETGPNATAMFEYIEALEARAQIVKEKRKVLCENDSEPKGKI